jgi:hypothetical protein
MFQQVSTSLNKFQQVSTNFNNPLWDNSCVWVNEFSTWELWAGRDSFKQHRNWGRKAET